MHRIAVIIDGGFFTKRYKQCIGSFPTGNSTQEFVKKAVAEVANDYGPTDIYRCFFYDCRPRREILTNPIDRTECDLSKGTAHLNQKLQDELTCAPLFALRLGTLALIPGKEWTIRDDALERLKTRALVAKDLAPRLSQKGVDMRMGLDIASLATKKIVSRLLIVSGDHDMIPAMKLARTEGIQVFLYSFAKSTHQDLHKHSDGVIIHSKIYSPSQEAK